jgi:hypothetical protein
MSAAWAAVLVAVVAACGSAATYIWRGGRREGRLDAILERLSGIAEDHESRIRAVERKH